MEGWGSYGGTGGTGSYGGGGSSGSGGGFNFSSALGGLGSIASIIGALTQSAGYNQTIGGLTSSLNQIIGPQTQFSEQMLQNYFSQVVPELQSTYGTATQQEGESYGTAGAFAGGATSAATALQSNPYLATQGKTIGGLLNYKSFTPQEEAELTTGAGAAASSAAATMKAQTGGVPNQALLEKNLVGQAGTTASQTAVQLGSIASQQHLQAIEAALQGEQTQGTQYLQGESEAAQTYSGLSSEYAGLSESELTAALDTLGIQSTESQTGISGLDSAEKTVGGLLGQVYQDSASNQGGFGGVMSGLTGLLSFLPAFA